LRHAETFARGKELASVIRDRWVSGLEQQIEFEHAACEALICLESMLELAEQGDPDTAAQVMQIATDLLLETALGVGLGVFRAALAARTADLVQP